MQIVFLLKDDYEKHSENAVGKGVKAPTRQNISAAIQKKEKGGRNLPEINQLCIVYEISSTPRAILPEPVMASEQTARLAEKDRERDKLVTAIFEEIRQVARSPIAARAESGWKRHYEQAVGRKTAPDDTLRIIWVGLNKNGSLYTNEKTALTSVVPVADTGSDV